jgi:hypothetical protein
MRFQTYRSDTASIVKFTKTTNSRPNLIALCTILHTRYRREPKVYQPKNKSKEVVEASVSEEEERKVFRTPPNAFNYHHTKYLIKVE